MDKKRWFTLLAVVMLVFAFPGIQAVAAGTEPGMKEGPMTGSESFRASDLMGMKVTNDQGEQLGDVNDIVISDTGRVQYLILSQGGVPGIGNKMIPVPFFAVRVNTMGNEVILSNIDKKKLEQAPSFTKEEWQSIGGPDFEEKVYSYYAPEPAPEPAEEVGAK